MPTVVIADDSPTLRRIVAAVLQRAGHTVVAADDGVSAVQAILATQPDAVVLDVQMPRLSGYAVSRLVKDDWRTSDIPVVLLTSLDAASDRYWGAHTGADRYLTKDFEAADLVAAVEDLVRRHRRALRPDPIGLRDDEVLTRICDLLDRKLFEATVTGTVTGIAASSHSAVETARGLLDVVGRFVAHDAAVLVLPPERLVLTRGTGPAADDLLVRSLAALRTAGEAPLGVGEVTREVLSGPAYADLATVLTMPMRGPQRRVSAVLGLGAVAAGGFGETALGTLKVLEPPAALALDAARAAVRVG